MSKRFNHSNAASRFVVAVAVLSACALAASCGSSSSTGGPSASPPTKSPPTPTPTPTATAEFTGLHQGSTVSFTQEVAGRLVGIPNGMDTWLVVRPILAPEYWPQRAPLHPDVNGHFDAVAEFGQNATLNSGEKFNLMIVESSPDASQRFQYFISHPQGMGLHTLPNGTTPLTQITVKRS